jgi:hypothetical protein
MSKTEVLDKGYSLHISDIDANRNIDTYDDEKERDIATTWSPPEEWLERLKDEYSGRHAGEALPPGCDPDRFAPAILTMNEEQAVECLRDIVENLDNDYTFDLVQAVRINELIAGPGSCNLEPSEWSYQVCKMAGICHNWSAYLEVRACTLPYDDVEEPCETFRAYLVGFFWVIIMTAVNTCTCHWVTTAYAEITQSLLLASLVYQSPIKCLN